MLLMVPCCVQAYKANPDSEEILLAAFKLEFENGEVARARLLLGRVRTQKVLARIEYGRCSQSL